MKLGIIGGSGLYQIEGMTEIKRQPVATPFGPPSDEFVCGNLHGVEAVFLPRHAQGHPLMPGELNHRANIYAMKMLGATHILSISAVGSLKENMKPRDVVVADQYFDRTRRGHEHTFFGNGVVGHIAFGHPVCPELSTLAAEAAAEAVKSSDNPARTVHYGGTYVNMEGPAFSTMAESKFYRAMGWSVIGMTNLAEAKLAREAEICYCTVAMVTDYDCWHPDHDHVSVEMVIGHLTANTALAREIIRQVAGKINALKRACVCSSALASAIITSPDAMNPETRQKLQPLIGKYVN